MCSSAVVQSLEAQNIRVLSFSSTCFLSPQIVIRAFILDSFPLPIKPPSVVLLQLICLPSVSNCFQYQLLGILLSGACYVVWWCHPPTVWITHSQAMLVHVAPAVLRVTFFNSFRAALSVCLDFPISDSSYPQTCDCVGFFLLPPTRQDPSPMLVYDKLSMVLKPFRAVLG